MFNIMFEKINDFIEDNDYLCFISFIFLSLLLYSLLFVHIKNLYENDVKENIQSEAYIYCCNEEFYGKEY